MIRTGTVTTDAFTMDYFKFGTGDRTFVILPGLSVQSVMGFAEAVAEAYQTLTEDHTVYLFDRRKDLPDPYSIKDMARDTAEAMHALGIKNADLFGASQGGMIAMEIAAGEPELLENLILGSSSAYADEKLNQTVENWISLARKGDREGLYLAFGKAVYPDEVYEQSKELIMAAAGTVTDEDLRRFAVMAEGLKGFDIRGDLAKIQCPVLILGSEDDKVLGPDASELLAEVLKDHAELYIYKGHGHAAYDTAPDYKERIKAFLKGR